MEQYCFLDDNKSIKSSMGIEVIGTSEEIFTHLDDYEIFIGIGNNVTRQKIHEMLETVGASIPALIHPNAVIGSRVKIGNGTAVMAGAVVNCCSRVGKSCIINTGSTIDHDNTIGDFVHVSPGAHLAGKVSVGQGTWLGIGTVVSNNVNITYGCTIGAGTVVVRDITEVGTYLGTPARRVR